MRNILTSHEKVVITQFNENNWFYSPMYDKWLAMFDSLEKVKYFKEIKGSKSLQVTPEAYLEPYDGAFLWK